MEPRPSLEIVERLLPILRAFVDSADLDRRESVTVTVASGSTNAHLHSNDWSGDRVVDDVIYATMDPVGFARERPGFARKVAEAVGNARLPAVDVYRPYAKRPIGTMDRDRAERMAAEVPAESRAQPGIVAILSERTKVLRLGRTQEGAPIKARLSVRGVFRECEVLDRTTEQILADAYRLDVPVLARVSLQFRDGIEDVASLQVRSAQLAPKHQSGADLVASLDALDVTFRESDD